jgi:hypothetical protein
MHIRIFIMKHFFPFSATWTPVSMTTVYSNYPSAGVHSASISSSLIPDTATEMLLYISTFCTNTGSNYDTYLEFYTSQNGATYRKYLYLYNWSGDYTMNSENMWLPTPDNRILYFYFPQSTGNCRVYVNAIGYR